MITIKPRLRDVLEVDIIRDLVESGQSILLMGRPGVGKTTLLREAARVLKKGAPLVFVPVKPSIVGSMLEILYNFKIHPLESVRTAAQKYFRILGNHEFPITEPIAWSKTIFLLEKM